MDWFDRLRMWIFARCSYCGGRFSWGLTPGVTRDMDGERYWHPRCHEAMEDIRRISREDQS